MRQELTLAHEHKEASHHGKPQPRPREHFQFQRADGGYRISRYTGPGGDVIIPEDVGPVAIVEIGGFEGCRTLLSVSTPP